MTRKRTFTLPDESIDRLNDAASGNVSDVTDPDASEGDIRAKIAQARQAAIEEKSGAPEPEPGLAPEDEGAPEAVGAPEPAAPLIEPKAAAPRVKRSRRDPLSSAVVNRAVTSKGTGPLTVSMPESLYRRVDRFEVAVLQATGQPVVRSAFVAEALRRLPDDWLSCAKWVPSREDMKSQRVTMDVRVPTELLMKVQTMFTMHRGSQDGLKKNLIACTALVRALEESDITIPE